MFPIKNLFRNLRKAVLEPRYAWKAFTRRLSSYLKYKFDKKGGSSYPEALTFFLTFKCNLRCKMCGQWGDSGTNKFFNAEKLAGEVRIEKFVELLDDVKGFKPSITLFGGEPLLYGEVDRLIREIKARGLHLCIITNGILVKKYAKAIVESGVDELSLSIDGDEELHDSIRGLKGGFTRIKEGADEINALKKERGVKLPIINIVNTMSALNYDKLEKMIEVAGSINAHTLNFHHLIYTDEKTVGVHNSEFKELFGCESKDWEGFIQKGAEKVDPAVLIEQIGRINKSKYPFLVNFYPNFSNDEIKAYYEDPGFVSKSYPVRCLSPWVVSYIYPDGGVYPCHSLGYPAGNINEKKFTEIWNGAEFRKFRMELQKRKAFRVCPRCTEKYRY